MDIHSTNRDVSDSREQDPRHHYVFASWLSVLQTEIESGELTYEELLDAGIEESERPQAIETLKTQLLTASHSTQMLRSQFPDLFLAINSDLGLSSSLLSATLPKANAFLQLPLHPDLQLELRSGLRFLHSQKRDSGWNVESIITEAHSHLLSERICTALATLPEDGTVLDVNEASEWGLGNTLLPQGLRGNRQVEQSPLSESEEKILEAIEVSKAEYLNLGLAHNPTINYRVSTGKRGLSILEGHERSKDVYDLLVNQTRRMSFLEQEDPHQELLEGVMPEQLEEPQEQLSEGFSDLRLQTGYNAFHMHQRLKHTAREARTYVEEHGTNALYLSLGMIHWREKGSSGQIRKAPLIMVPTTLNRNGPTQRFRLEYSGEEIETNLTLLAKMKDEFGLEIPPIPEGQNFDPVRYMQEVEIAIESFKDSIDGRAPYIELAPDEMHVDLWPMGKNIISRDLDPDLWPEGQKPYQNRVLRGLFGEGLDPAALDHLQAERLDDVVDLRRILTILDCDSAQMDALLSAMKNDLDVEGPPGTGKTQFIVNLIAQCVSQGKSVLFVSEKLDALQVAHRKLESHGLGPTCLQLHSDKSSKREAIEQLREPFLLGSPQIAVDSQLIERVESELRKLNGYRDALHAPIDRSQTSPYDAMGESAHLRITHGELLDLKPELFGAWTDSDYASARLSVQYLQDGVNQFGHPKENPFWGSRISKADTHIEADLAQKLDVLAPELNTLTRATAALSSSLQLPDEMSFQQISLTAKALRALLRAPNLDELHVDHDSWHSESPLLNSLLTAGEESTTLRARRSDELKADAWTAPIDKQVELTATCSSAWYNIARPAYLLSLWEMSKLTKGFPPLKPSKQKALLDDIVRVQSNSALLSRNRALRDAAFGNSWKGAGTNWSELREKVTHLTEFHQQFAEANCFHQLLNALPTLQSAEHNNQIIHSFLNAFERYEHTLSDALHVLKFTSDETDRQIHAAPLSSHQNTIQSWKNNISGLATIADMNDRMTACHERGAQFVVDEMVENPDLAHSLLSSFDHGWFDSIAHQAFEERVELDLFERQRHETVQARFQTDDKLLLKHNIDTLANQLYNELPKHVTGGRLGYLMKQLQLQRGHDPTRKLLEESGPAIHAVKKVFMMSPYSVAKFLTPGSTNFDVVIVDEGSQLPPLHVLGAAMRGELLVVCGDRQQLDPPNFFQGKRNVELSSELSATADHKNILEFMQHSGAQESMLTGHYRSRHQSNIAISNSEFYDNKLRIYPSPYRKREGLGLHFRHIPSGVYDRGESRTNIIEARAVAASVLEHSRNRPEQTLGVAAFSVAQMEAIEDEIEKLSRVHPELADYMVRHAHEPFFVKNLEHVQGDERDFIFVSLGYGFDREMDESPRRLDRSFGPVNKDGGEKRLNVLFTRARLSTVVFSNFKAEDLGNTAELSRGVQVLQKFLHFAQTGSMDFTPQSQTGSTHPLEQALAEGLRRQGLKVEIGIGDKGGRVNLAIVNPEDKEHYIAGVLLDDEEYQTTRLARDQDRIKGEMLQSLGWNLHRSWSVDLYRSPEAEAKRIAEEIRASILLQRLKGSAGSSPSKSTYQPTRSTLKDLSISRLAGTPYRQAEIDRSKLPTEIQELDREHLSQIVLSIVEQEHPVHQDVVRRRVRDVFEVSTLPARVERKLLESLEYAQSSGSLRIHQGFLYSPDVSEYRVRDRSSLPAGQKRFNQIPPEEVEGAVQLVIASSYGIREEELAHAVSKTLGFQSEAQGAKEAVGAVIDSARANGLIDQHGDFLYISNRVM